ncbi:MAG: HAMP domain-containing sensor histidine kinase [Polyangiales bacterium]
MGSPISASNKLEAHQEARRARARILADAATPVEPTSQSMSILTDAQLLRRTNAELELLYSVEQLIAAAHGLSDLVASVLDRLASHMSFEAAALLLVDDQGRDGTDDAEVVSVLRDQPLTRRSIPRDKALQWLEQTRERRTRVVDSEVSEAPEVETDGLLAERPRAALLKIYDAQFTGGGFAGVLQLIAPQELSDADEVVLRRLGLVAALVGRAIMLRRERDRELYSERMTQLGRSLDAILHDLHTPLMAVAGYVEIMASADAQEVRREYAERTGRGLEHVERMVREVLAYARGQREVTTSPVALPRFVEETRELLATELARFGAELEIKLQYTGSARLDAHKLERVWWNLARRAGEAGAKKLVWQIERVGEHLVFEHRDDGPSMPLAVRAQLEGGVVTEDAQQGLGLLIVRAIVDAHRGRIQVTSDVEKGTVVRIELPF